MEPLNRASRSELMRIGARHERLDHGASTFTRNTCVSSPLTRMPDHITLTATSYVRPTTSDASSRRDH
jgi:hypothetical protein